MESTLLPEEIEQLKNANRDLRRSFDQLTAIQNLSIKVSGSKSIEDIVSSIVTVIPQIIECFSCKVYLFENERFHKIGEAVYNQQQNLSVINEELIYWCCKRKSVTVLPGSQETQGKAIAPLIQASVIIGAIILDLDENFGSYSEEIALALSTVANHAALAIANYQSHSLLADKASMLNDMKEYVDRVIASIAHSIITVDPDGKITVFNRKAEEFFEIRSKIALGNLYTVVFPDYLQTAFSSLLQSLQADKIPEPLELSFTTLYQEQKHTQIIASPLRISGAAKPGMVCVCRNLALTKEVERLKELDNMKDDFISMVSHELKTPLASIMAYSETLLSGLADTKEEQQEYLQVINNEGHRLSHLVNNILDLSKIESGKMQYNMDTFKPADLINRSVRAIVNLSEKKKQLIKPLIDEDIPYVIGDYEKLTQVIINILSNAVKFTPPKGEITIGAKRKEQGRAAATVEFYVQDTGCGISKNDIPKVFDKFTQIEDVMNHVEGTGLGMPISKKIIEQHNSELVLKSKVGSGSCFSFRLPIADN